MTSALGESIDTIPEEQGTCQFRRRSAASAGLILVYRNDGDLAEKQTEVIRAGYDQIVQEPQVGPGCFRGNNNAYAYASTLTVYYVCEGWEFGMTVKSAQQSERLDVAAKYLAEVY